MLHIFLFHTLSYNNKLCLLWLCMFLNNSCDTNLMITKHLCNCCKNTWFICHLHTDKELILHIPNVFYRKVLITCTADSSIAAICHISRNIDHISHNCTGCWELSCTASIEHCIICCISMNKNCIKGISYRCKRVFLMDHHWVNTYFNSTLCVMCYAKQLDHTVKFFRIFDIFRCDLCDSFCKYVRKYDSGMERDRSHDRYLTSCIKTFYI